MDNLQHVWTCLPHKGRLRLLREMFIHLGRSALECVVLHRLAGRFGTPADPVRFSPGALEALMQAAAPGKGVLYVTAHMGNWELMGAAVARHLPVSVLYKPSYDPRFTRMICRFREAHGVRGIDVSRPGHLKKVLRALRQGSVVGVLLDQPSEAGEMIPFLGRPAPTSTLVTTMARRTGAAVVAGFIVRQGRARHEVSIVPLGQAGRPPDVRACLKPMERAITRAPAQWIWSLNRWRLRGQGKDLTANNIPAVKM